MKKSKDHWLAELAAEHVSVSKASVSLEGVTAAGLGVNINFDSPQLCGGTHFIF